MQDVLIHKYIYTYTILFIFKHILTLNIAYLAPIAVKVISMSNDDTYCKKTPNVVALSALSAAQHLQVKQKDAGIDLCYGPLYALELLPTSIRPRRSIYTVSWRSFSGVCR